MTEKSTVYTIAASMVDFARGTAELFGPEARATFEEAKALMDTWLNAVGRELCENGVENYDKEESLDKLGRVINVLIRSTEKPTYFEIRIVEEIL